MKVEFWVRQFRFGLENLMLQKLRSGLTMLGVVFGVGSVIAMLSVGEGASREALDQIRRLGSSNIMIDSVRPSDAAVQGGERRYISIYGLTYDDYERAMASFEWINRIVPVKHIPTEGRLDDREMNLRIVATTPDWFDVVKRELIAGRVLTEEDVLEKRAVAVLTEYSARGLLAANNTIGQHVSIGKNMFEVVGIVKSEAYEGRDIQTPDEPIDMYVPLDVIRERFGDIHTRRTAGTFERNRVELHQMIVEVDEPGHVEATADGLERLLERFHQRKDYKLSVPLALLREARRTARTFNIVLGSIAAISLLVGGIGIMNIMLASVTERTREIGIRRAVGARRSQIVIQFLIETVALTFVGGLIGVLFGLAVPRVITMLAGMPTATTLWSICLSLFISLGIGILFGLYPAVRAARLDPIIALRHE